MQQVTFKDCELGDVILALQHYAMHLEERGLHASAASQYDLAARAARAYGWPHQAASLASNAAQCRKQSLVSAREEDV